jgi:hypothetical protein
VKSRRPAGRRRRIWVVSSLPDRFNRIIRPPFGLDCSDRRARADRGHGARSPMSSMTHAIETKPTVDYVFALVRLCAGFTRVAGMEIWLRNVTVVTLILAIVIPS